MMRHILDSLRPVTITAHSMTIEYDHRADHYIALGVASTATHDDIKKAHRTLIRELHPDHGGESMSAAQVNIARDVLLNPITREEYDEARRGWHERNPIVGAFTDAAHHGGRTSQQPAPASQQTHGVRSAHAQQAGSLLDPEDARREPPHGWQVDIMTMLVADEFMRATLSRQWLKAIAIIGSAYILDRVIENRIRKHPAGREVIDAIAHELRQQRATRLTEALFTKAGYRWDPATDRWILPAPELVTPKKPPSAAPSAASRPRSPQARGSVRPGATGRQGRPRSS